MIVAFLTLITALLLAAVAAWFSIIGVVAFFSGQILAASIMGIVLELGKIITATWLKNNWSETSWLLKAPLIFIFVILMFITSMGIFTFLSKAHVEQGAEAINNSSKIEYIDQQLISLKQHQDDDRGIIKQLDNTVNSLISHDKISGNSGAKTTRQQQKSERDNLEKELADDQKKIDDLNSQRLELDKIVKNFNLELGPVKYLAQLLYDNPDQNIDKAVRLFIMMIIFVFDPLAVLLLIGANQSFINRRKKKSEILKPLVKTEESVEAPLVEAPLVEAPLVEAPLVEETRPQENTQSPEVKDVDIAQPENQVNNNEEPSIDYIREQLDKNTTTVAKTKDEIQTSPVLKNTFLVHSINK